MLEKWKQKITHTSKEVVKEEIKSHMPEIIQGVTLVILGYICIKVNNKPVNITINLNGRNLY